MKKTLVEIKKLDDAITAARAEAERQDRRLLEIQASIAEADAAAAVGDPSPVNLSALECELKTLDGRAARSVLALQERRQRLVSKLGELVGPEVEKRRSLLQAQREKRMAKLQAKLREAAAIAFEPPALFNMDPHLTFLQSAEHFAKYGMWSASFPAPVIVEHGTMTSSPLSDQDRALERMRVSVMMGDSAESIARQLLRSSGELPAELELPPE